jgi:hypothetical protein
MTIEDRQRFAQFGVTMRILRVFGISIRACPSPRFAACRPRPFRRLTPDRSDRAVAVLAGARPWPSLTTLQ